MNLVITVRGQYGYRVSSAKLSVSGEGGQWSSGKRLYGRARIARQQTTRLESIAKEQDGRKNHYHESRDISVDLKVE
jgi:hypothetical protein